MKRIAIALGATTALALLTAGCVEGGYYEGGYASTSVGYTNCDYYAPALGLPARILPISALEPAGLLWRRLVQRPHLLSGGPRRKYILAERRLAA